MVAVLLSENLSAQTSFPVRCSQMSAMRLLISRHDFHVRCEVSTVKTFVLKATIVQGGYVEELEGGELPQGGMYTAVKACSRSPLTFDASSRLLHLPRFYTQKAPQV